MPRGIRHRLIPESTPEEYSNHLLQSRNATQLWYTFCHSGYLFLRNAIPCETILNAREKINRSLKSMNHIHNSKSNHAISKNGFIVEMESGTVTTGQNDYADENDVETLKWKELCKSNELNCISHSKVLFDLLQLLAFGKCEIDGKTHNALLLDSRYSWLRIKAPNEFTTEHVDWYYFKVYIS